MRIWSYLMTGVADRSWDISTSIEAWNCHCVVLKILMECLRAFQGFQGLKFLNFNLLCVLSFLPFFVEYQLLLENYCNSLLVY